MWVMSSELLDSSKRKGLSLTCFLLLLAELSGWTLDWLILSPCQGLPMGSVTSLVSAPVFSPGEQFPWVRTQAMLGLHLVPSCRSSYCSLTDMRRTTSTMAGF